jgi:hypothetical protein
MVRKFATTKPKPESVIYFYVSALELEGCADRFAARLMVTPAGSYQELQLTRFGLHKLTY